MAYSQFAFDEKYYLPENFGAKGGPSYAEMRKEYAHLYRVAQRRLKVFEKHGSTNAPAYRYNKNLKPQSKLDNTSLSYALHDVYNMLKAEGGTYTGYKRQLKRKVERLNELGLTFVNNANVEDFDDFMEWWRQNAAESVYSSEQVAQLYGQAVKKQIDTDQLKDNFDFFAKNVRQLAATPKIRRHGQPGTADDYRKALKIQRGKWTRTTHRLEAQAREKGVDIFDIDTDYWRDPKNLRELEKMDAVPGKSAAYYKSQLAAERRRKTRQKNARKKRRKK